jgi:23S rRNA maturation-related 3'-5' exoribonuclease YhaM
MQKIVEHLMMKIRSHNFKIVCVMLIAYGVCASLHGMDPLRLEKKQPGIAPGLVNPADYAAWLASHSVPFVTEIDSSASETESSSSESEEKESPSNLQEYACFFCTKRYSTFSSLRAHAYKEHEKKPEIACNGCNRKFKFYHQLALHNHFIASAAKRASLGIKCSKARVRKGQKICQCVFPNEKQQPCGVLFTMRTNCIGHIARKHHKSRLAAAEFVLDLK